MLLSEILTKVGRRVADPNLDTYSGVVQDYFEQAFVTLIKKRSEGSLLPYYENEILPLISSDIEKITINNGYGTLDVSTLSNMLYIYDLSTTVDFVVNYRYISAQELNDKIYNPNLFPTSSEGYWSKLGKYIRVLTGITGASIAFHVGLVKNPETDKWTDTTSFGDYGLGFLYDAIELASSLLRRQIGMEE